MLTCSNIYSLFRCDAAKMSFRKDCSLDPSPDNKPVHPPHSQPLGTQRTATPLCKNVITSYCKNNTNFTTAEAFLSLPNEARGYFVNKTQHGRDRRSLQRRNCCFAGNDTWTMKTLCLSWRGDGNEDDIFAVTQREKPVCSGHTRHRTADRWTTEVREWQPIVGMKKRKKKIGRGWKWDRNGGKIWKLVSANSIKWSAEVSRSREKSLPCCNYRDA